VIKKLIPVMVMIQLMVLFPGLAPAAGTEHGEKNLVKHLKRIFFLAEKNLYDARIILGLKEKINLSAEQERNVERLMLNYQETTIRGGAEVKIEELRLVSYLNSGKIDRKETTRRIREISKKKTDLIIDYMNYLLDLREMLTAKQLEILQEIKEKKKNKINKRLNERARESG